MPEHVAEAQFNELSLAAQEHTPRSLLSTCLGQPTEFMIERLQRSKEVLAIIEASNAGKVVCMPGQSEVRRQGIHHLSWFS